MNLFKRRSRGNSELEEDWKPSGSFVKKPVKGWIHPDHQLNKEGVVYQNHYIGAVKVVESMRTIPFDQRGAVVREAITRCCQESNLFNFKKKKVSLTHGIIGDVYLDSSGEETTSTYSKSSIKSIIMRNGVQLYDHAIENISFASIGDNEYKNMIGYISKDPHYVRACFVFQCSAGLSEDIILTIGQAFELKYKEYLSCNPVIQPVVGRRPTSVGGNLYSTSGGIPPPRLFVVKVPGKFTDPVFDSPLEHKPAIVPHNNKKEETEDFAYSQLFSGVNKSKGNTSYDSLNRNKNSIITTDDRSEINFATGASYGHEVADYATVYDNPIASASVRAQFEALSFDSAMNDDRDMSSDGGASSFECDPEYLKSVDVNRKNKPPLLPQRPESKSHDVIQYSEVKLCSTPNPLLSERWFHGHISRSVAENLLKKDGDFVVRESASTDGQYVLSGMKDGQYRHLLLVDPQGQVRTRDHTFDSVNELVKFHVNENRPIFSGNSEVYLLQPVFKN